MSYKYNEFCPSDGSKVVEPRESKPFAREGSKTDQPGLEPGTKKNPKKRDFRGEPEAVLSGIDWLQLHCKCTATIWGDELYEVNGFKLTKGHQNETWINMYTIDYKGLPFGILKATPRASNIALDLDDVHLKLDNALLYTDFRDSVLHFAETFGLEFSHVSRLDLFWDGYYFLNPLNKWMQNKILRVNYGNQGNPHTRFRFENNQAFFNYFLFGASQSKKQLRCYDKGREVKVSNKAHIVNWWKLNGLTDLDNVERCELVLNVEIMQHIFKNDYVCKDATPMQLLNHVLTWIMDIQFQTEVMEKYLPSLYTFRLKDATQVKNCTPTGVIKHNFKLSDKLWRGIKLLSTIVKKISDGVYMTKMCLKHLDQMARKTGKQVFRDMRDDIAYNSYLSTYVQEREPYWAYEVRQKYKQQIPFLDFHRYYEGGRNKIIHSEPYFPEQATRDVLINAKAHAEMMALSL